MGRYCCVPGCRVRGSGHEFPRDKNMRLKWRIAVSRQDEHRKGTLWEPKPSSIVCIGHFVPADYNETLLGARRRLKATAVPSVFNFKEKATPDRLREIRMARRTATQSVDIVLEAANEVTVTAEDSNGEGHMQYGISTAVQETSVQCDIITPAAK